MVFLGTPLNTLGYHWIRSTVVVWRLSISLPSVCLWNFYVYMSPSLSLPCSFRVLFYACTAVLHKDSRIPKQISRVLFQHYFLLYITLVYTSRWQNLISVASIQSCPGAKAIWACPLALISENSFQAMKWGIVCLTWFMSHLSRVTLSVVQHLDIVSCILCSL